MPARTIPLQVRFEQKVRLFGKLMPGMKTRCEEWKGATFKPTEYGAIQVNGRAKRAHRIAWELSGRVIPPGKDVLHRCDNKACVRLSHLYLGTDKENGRDRAVRGQAASGSRHGRAKLDEAAVASIRTRLAQGETRAALAREHDVDWSTVDDIHSGKKWKRAG